MRDGNSVLVGYITANENPILSLSVQQMLSYSWVSGVVILDTCSDAGAVETPRLARYHRNFGQGFGRSVHNGGFDEVGARNLLLQEMRRRARETNTEWLLICDSDEYYTPKTGSLPAQLNRAGKDIAWLNCWHLLSPDTYLYHPKYSALLQGSRMYDPHPRLFRVSAYGEYVPNMELGVVYPDVKNDTMHCYLHFESGEDMPIPGIFHLHLRHLLGKSEVPADYELRKLSPPIRLPDQYLKYKASIEDTEVL